MDVQTVSFSSHVYFVNSIVFAIIWATLTTTNAEILIVDNPNQAVNIMLDVDCHDWNSHRNITNPTQQSKTPLETIGKWFSKVDDNKTNNNNTWIYKRSPQTTHGAYF